MFVVKSEALYPAHVGGVTDVKVNKSPASNPCAGLLTVTVASLFTVSNVQPVKAVSNGVIS